MQTLAVAAAIAMLPMGALAASQGPPHLSEKQMDTISAGQRNVHVHPPAAVDTVADGLSLPDAAGTAVDATDASALGDHQ